MRPIDADALIKAIGKLSFKDMSGEEMAMVFHIHDMISDAPTLDYAPVVHGSWVEYDEGNPLPLDWRYRCDLCGCPQDYAHNFFPECGARMAVKNNAFACC